MTARLLSFPIGLPITKIEPLSGPRTVQSGSTQSVGGFVQTVASPFGMLKFRMNFGPMRGVEARRYRGWITALHGGANATRVPWLDGDNLSDAEAGIVGGMSPKQWSNGMPWSNGQYWSGSYPIVPIAQQSAIGDTVIHLQDEFWGASLGYGDQIGFTPFHFGLYMVTEVIDAGIYRIWPPLRKALTTDDFATLRPVLAMRLESEDSASAARGPAFIDNASVTLVEVLDYDVRDYWTD